ncbi:hypothetical protein [Desulfitobacterium sp. PCE1]|nr:hypothetical protein [Desulfitobacterium sp. PCE1]
MAAKVIQFPMNDKIKDWLIEEEYRIFWEADDPYNNYEEEEENYN